MGSYEGWQIPLGVDRSASARALSTSADSGSIDSIRSFTTDAAEIKLTNLPCAEIHTFSDRFRTRVNLVSRPSCAAINASIIAGTRRRFPDRPNGLPLVRARKAE